MTPLLSVFPPSKTNKQTCIGIKKIWDVQMSQLVSEVPIWRVRVPPEWWAVRARRAWTTPYRKHPWYQNRSKRGAGQTAHWSLGTQSRARLLCCFPLLRWEAYCFALSGSAARKAALRWRWAQVELRAWVGSCTANVLFWSRVCGEACLVGTADKTKCGSFQMTTTVTESAMRWAK